MEEQKLDSNSLSAPDADAGELSPEQMEALAQLAAGIKGGKGGKITSFKHLKEVRLIDAEMLGKLCEGKPCDKDVLIAYLCKNCNGNCSVAAAMCNIPGKGGVNRGRGDAQLTWKDPASEEGVKFQEKALPQGQLDSLRQSNLIGVSTGAPEVVDPAAVSLAQSAALGSAQAGGGSANRQTILPRHREAVNKYFERN